MEKDEGAIYTYFIRDVDRDLIKIGISKNPRTRYSSIRTSNPGNLELVLTLPGNMERRLHDQFASLKHRGEWYRLEQPLMEFLKAYDVEINLDRAGYIAKKSVFERFFEGFDDYILLPDYPVVKNYMDKLEAENEPVADKFLNLCLEMTALIVEYGEARENGMSFEEYYDSLKDDKEIEDHYDRFHFYPALEASAFIGFGYKIHDDKLTIKILYHYDKITQSSYNFLRDWFWLIDDFNDILFEVYCCLPGGEFKMHEYFSADENQYTFFFKEASDQP